MNNVATNLLKNLEGAKVGPVGGTISALDSVSSQLKQLADATGFTNNYVNTGSGAIDDYLRKNLGDGIFSDAVYLYSDNTLSTKYSTTTSNQFAKTETNIVFKIGRASSFSDPVAEGQVYDVEICGPVQ